MVEGISRLNGTQQAQGSDGGVKHQEGYGNQAVYNFTPDNQGKGTSVQRQGGNPFYADVDSEVYKDEFNFNKKNSLDIAGKVQDAYDTLAAKYDDVTQKMQSILRNPNASQEAKNLARNALTELQTMSFQDMPTPAKKGNQAERIKNFEDKLYGSRTNDEVGYLDRMLQKMDALLEDYGLNTILTELNRMDANADQRARQTQSLIVATSSAELQAIQGLEERMVEGLTEIKGYIGDATHKIITAVNANGDRIIRAIDTSTGAIKEVVVKEGETTRESIETAKQFLKREIETHSVTWHGLPDPMGLTERIWDGLFGE